MFYKMIEAKRNQWLLSDGCTVKDLLDYIEKTGQISTLKTTALSLTISCSAPAI